MPWNETCAMEERMKFVTEYSTGEWSKSVLCRKYGISRPTGDKWLLRYEASGVAGLSDRSRAPRHRANATPSNVEADVVACRHRYPRWGPRKIRAWLSGQDPERIWPAASTMGEILTRHGLTRPRKRRRRAAPYTEPFVACDRPNAVWCIDFKGWFRTQDQQRCDPLTLSDAYSRYLLLCRALEDGTCARVRPWLEAAFVEYGLPWAIRSDNGPPFASTGLLGLTRLSVWWIKLGIVPERIAPGQPQQNGRHERLHRTLREEAINPPRSTRRSQQRAFNRFQREYNHERPHEALGQQTPASHYRRSPRPYPRRVPPPTYPEGTAVRRVRKRGQFSWRDREVFLSEALSGEPVGLVPVDGRYWRVYFCTQPLCLLDDQTLRVLPLTQRIRCDRG